MDDDNSDDDEEMVVVVSVCGGGVPKPIHGRRGPFVSFLWSLWEVVLVIVAVVQGHLEFTVKQDDGLEACIIIIIIRGGFSFRLL